MQTLHSYTRTRCIQVVMDSNAGCRWLRGRTNLHVSVHKYEKVIKSTIVTKQINSYMFHNSYRRRYVEISKQILHAYTHTRHNKYTPYVHSHTLIISRLHYLSARMQPY